MDDYKKVSCDVLVIGEGGAGLRAAIEASGKGSYVVLVSKTLLGKAHTVMAEGGIAAAVANVDSKDTWQVHFSDTIVEGDYIGDWRMAEILVKEAPERVYELERYGALFDRTPDGRIMQRAFGAHTYRRLCHVGDKTGLELIRTLEDRILHSNVSFMDELMITKLAKRGNRIIGAIGLDLKEGKYAVIESKAVVIATGGGGKIYKTTSNSKETTGDGIALALDAGAELRDMEMVQFHPTGMVYPHGVKGVLVTEGARGEGGILLNSKGERFMLRYSPKLKELDARDVVARAIYNEIKSGNGTEHGGVYLDVTHMSGSFIKKKLPAMYEQFLEFAGVDITKEKMEVAPTVHYFMGGIGVDPENCSTSMDGLFAAGEVAGGLHGANRLGGNSLADILVFGRRAGSAASDYAGKVKNESIGGNEISREIKRIRSYLANGKESPYALIEELRKSMSMHVGIIRERSGLSQALEDILKLRKRSGGIGVEGGEKYNQGLVACIELGFMLNVAECIVRSALERKESRGAHARSDYPAKKREWKGNIYCKSSRGGISLRLKEVPEMPARLGRLVTPERYT
ncbi:MAG: FAD-binding protein [Candidatus Micrarchaeota archaeon]|nr:FAD-binding protein [Candidatus Micrarchaeota archaeon]